MARTGLVDVSRPTTRSLSQVMGTDAIGSMLARAGHKVLIGREHHSGKRHKTFEIVFL